MSDTFYSDSKLTPESKMELLKLAYGNCTSFEIDTLDCKVSIARRSVKNTISFNDFLEILKNKLQDTTIIIIDRDGYLNVGYSEQGCVSNVRYGEIGIRITDPEDKDKEYFLFLFLNSTKLQMIIKKYSLETL